MRQHKITCKLHVDDKMRFKKYMQHKINECTIYCIERSMSESGLTQKEQIQILEGLLNGLKSSQ